MNGRRISGFVLAMAAVLSVLVPGSAQASPDSAGVGTPISQGVCGHC